jgi:hypothetical protein
MVVSNQQNQLLVMSTHKTTSPTKSSKNAHTDLTGEEGDSVEAGTVEVEAMVAEVAEAMAEAVATAVAVATVEAAEEDTAAAEAADGTNTRNKWSSPIANNP